MSRAAWLPHYQAAVGVWTAQAVSEAFKFSATAALMRAAPAQATHYAVLSDSARPVGSEIPSRQQAT